MEADAVETLIAGELATKAIGRHIVSFSHGRTLVILAAKDGKSSRSHELALWSRRYWTDFFSFIIFFAASSFIPNILYTHSSVHKRISSPPFSQQACGILSKLRIQHLSIAMIYLLMYADHSHLIGVSSAAI